MTAGAHRCLVLGGARSGKSAWAERRLHSDAVRYVATGYGAADDPEWAARLRRHRERRPATWETFETLDLAAALRSADQRPLLIDCLTLWLTRTMDEAQVWGLPVDRAGAAIGPAIDELVAALSSCSCEVVMVSNEVGSGVVPATASARLFADHLGELNCRIAAACDEVVLLVAGIPLPIKGPVPAWRKGQL